MNMLAIAPLQWSDLKDIDDVEPINDEDAGCLVEVRDVLRKYGKMERFGVALLHNHFAIKDDEVMLESIDHENRTLVSKPVKRDELANGGVATVLMLRDGTAPATMFWCRQFCQDMGPLLSHRARHNREK